MHEFLTQFNFIASSNVWCDAARIVALASCLRGKARVILDGDTEIESLTYAELTARLELSFDEKFLAQLRYLKFACRKQKFGEASLLL